MWTIFIHLAGWPFAKLLVPVSLILSLSSCRRITGLCAIQSWEKAAIKSGWMCGWDWDLSDLQTRQRHRRSGQWIPDGSFSVNRREDLEYFFYCPQSSHLSLSRQNTDVRVHFEEHLGRKAQPCDDHFDLPLHLNHIFLYRGPGKKVYNKLPTFNYM